MTKYVATSKYQVNGSEGFITHQDQEVDNLAFNILFDYEGASYVKVDGDEAKIEAWRVRVEGTYKTEQEVLDIEATLPVIEDPEL